MDLRVPLVRFAAENHRKEKENKGKIGRAVFIPGIGRSLSSLLFQKNIYSTKKVWGCSLQMFTRRHEKTSPLIASRVCVDCVTYVVFL